MSIDKLESLYEALAKTPDIQVGVFSGKTSRSDGDMDNAALAKIHEFGSPEHGLPARSMLRIPLADHAQQIMAPFFSHGMEFLKTNTLKQLYENVGAAGLKIVMQAFDTGGFGKWVPLTYGTMLAKLNRGKNGTSLKKRKGILAKIYSGQVGMGILIDTAQLRRSFSYRVRMK